MLTQRLIGRFVYDHQNVQDPQVRYAYGRLASVTGLVCNLVLLQCGWQYGDRLAADRFDLVLLQR